VHLAHTELRTIKFEPDYRIDQDWTNYVSYAA